MDCMEGLRGLLGKLLQYENKNFLGVSPNVCFVYNKIFQVLKMSVFVLKMLIVLALKLKD